MYAESWAAAGARPHVTGIQLSWAHLGGKTMSPSSQQQAAVILAGGVAEFEQLLSFVSPRETSTRYHPHVFLVNPLM